MIKIVDNNFIGIGVIKNVLSATRIEEINGENTLDFTTILDNKTASLITDFAIFEVDGQYFDVAYLEKSANDDNTFTIDVEAEHISYRLNNPTYNMEYFTQTGLPSSILTELLNATNFSVGTLGFSTSVTYSAQEAKSRRQLVMEFVAYLGGEVIFNNFVVNIVVHRGSTEVTSIIKDRNIRIVKKTLNKRQKDEQGNDLVSYSCTPIYLPGDSYALGDNVVLRQPELGLNEQLRVVRLTTNPYDEMDTSLVFSNYINDLASSLFRIETSSLVKGKIYYGARISPENGFESIRSDLMARTVMNADKFEMQSGDGTGLWIPRIYFDPELRLYIFDGTLSADTIEALKAEIDIVISNTIIVENLSADKATIAELTVDRIDTSDKVGNYKAIPPITTDVDYFKGSNEVIEFVTASKKETGTLFVYNRYGTQLYWTDATKTGVTDEANDYPIQIFDYNELTKLKIFFKEIDGIKIPVIELGAGSGVPGHPDYGKSFIYKGPKGAYWDYYHSVTGELRRMMLTDDGVDFSESVTSKVIYSEQTIVEGVIQIFVDDDFPVGAKDKDILVDTNDYTSADMKVISTTSALLLTDNPYIEASGTITITLFDPTTVVSGSDATGVLFSEIKNVGTGLVTITGLINGSTTSVYIYPDGAKRFSANGTTWRVL